MTNAIAYAPLLIQALRELPKLIDLIDSRSQRTCIERREVVKDARKRLDASNEKMSKRKNKIEDNKNGNH